MVNRPMKRWIRDLIFLIILFVIAVAFATTFHAQQKQLDRIKEKQIQASALKADLEIELSGLQQKIEFTKSEQYLEQIARLKFGWIKKDEIVLEPISTAGKNDNNDLNDSLKKENAE